MSPVPDAASPRARALADQRRASDPAASSWVGASAGTGKTRVLTDRVLRLLLAGTPPQRILCLTFTKAAAAEMANRLSGNLAAWAVIGDANLADHIEALTGARPEAERLRLARLLFAQVLDAPGGVRLQTIHAFCQALLKRFPVEAGVPPHFTVLEERDSLDLIEGVKREVLAAALPGHADADAALAAALEAVTDHATEYGFDELFGELTAARGRLRHHIGGVGGIDLLSASIHRALGVGQGETPTEVLAEAADDRTIDLVGLRRAAEAMIASGGVIDARHGGLIAAWLDNPDGRIDGFDEYESAFVTGKGTRRKDLIHKDALAAAPMADETLSGEAERLAAVRARLDAVTVARASAGLMRLGAHMLQAYERRKRARAMLDFDDLILGARALLAERDDAAWVLYKLDGGIDHILIDEAQDTDPDQWAVVKALAEEFFAGEGAREGAPDAPRSVFAVGDVKQSIFSFRGADPGEFEAMRRYFEARVSSAGRQWRPVGLDVSFRSTEAVLEAVDAVFAGTAAREGVAPPDAGITHIAERTGQAGLVELWPPVRPRERDVGEDWSPPVEALAGDAPRARLADRIARTVAGWIEDGELLESKGRPIRARDVMVLVRRRKGFVDELVRALRRRGVSVAGVDRMMLAEQIAVMDLIALGRFLLLPEDNLTLAALLKSPLIGLDEDQLFALAHGRGDTSLWAALAGRAGEDPAFGHAHRLLSGQLARTDFTPPYELFADLVEAGGGRAALVGRLGHEAEDAIDEFLALALAYERGHVPSLEGFLHWLEAGETEVTRDLEQGDRDEVRILTVHGAKGLQAPIVFLADTMALPRTDVPRILWPAVGGPDAPIWAPRRALERTLAADARAAVVGRDEEEYRRLLYVAMTRAEDRLYICGWETRRAPSDRCWYRLVESGLADRGTPVAFDFGEGWAGAGRRIASGAAAEAATVMAAPSAPQPLPDWAHRPPAPEPVPPRPFAPSRPHADEPPVRSPLGPDEGYRFQRGLLIHRLLQSLPDIAAPGRAAAARRYLALPVHGLDDERAEAIAGEALAVLDEPAFAPLFGPGSMAEVPLTGVIGGQVVTGQVDRLLVAGRNVTVLDYKTNRPPPEREADVAPAYLRQMAAYRAVLRAIYPERTVGCVLLWTDGPRAMALSESALDAHAPGAGAAKDSP